MSNKSITGVPPKGRQVKGADEPVAARPVKKGGLAAFLKRRLSPGLKRRLKRLRPAPVRAELERVNRSLKELEARLAALHNELGESKNGINALDNQVLVLENELAGLRPLPEKLGSVESFLLELPGQLASVRDEVVQMIGEEATAWEPLSRRVSALEESLNEVNALSNQMLVAQEQLGLLQSVPARLQNVEADSNQLNALGNQMIVLRSEVEAFRSLLDKLGAFEASISGLEELPGRLTALRDEMTAAQDEESASLEPLKERLNALSGSLSQLNGLSNQLGLLQTVPERLQAVEASMNELNALSNQMIVLRGEVEAFRPLPEKLGALETSISGLAARPLGTAAQSEESASSEPLKGRLTALGQSGRQLDGLTNQLQIVRDQLGALQTVPERLQAVEASMNELNALSNQTIVLQGEVEAFRSLPEKLTALEASIAGLEELPRSLRALRDEMTAVQGEDSLAPLKERLSALGGSMDHLDDLSNQLLSVRDQLGSLQTVPERLQAVEASMNELNALSNQMIVVQGEVEAFRSLPERLGALEASISGLEELPRSLRALRDEMTTVQSEESAFLEPLKERLRLVEQAKETKAVAELESAAENFDGLKAALDTLQGEMGSLKPLPAKVASLETSLSEFDDLKKLPADLEGGLNAIEGKLSHFEASLRRAQSEGWHDLRRDLLMQRRVLLDRMGETQAPSSQEASSASLGKPRTMEECFEALAEMAPRAFPVWKGLLQVNASSYEGFPVDSCSVPGHPMAETFGSFLRPYWGGRVLDVGCGPQPVPSYLEGYPLDLVYGIDPLTRPEDHLFHFVPGVAELLPWGDQQFQLVVIATSLDHVLLLDRSLKEIWRVLKTDGHFVVWVGFVPGSPEYDPHGADIQPVDAYHLFHFERPWFERVIDPLFEIREAFHFNEPYNSSFYSLRPKALEEEAR